MDKTKIVADLLNDINKMKANILLFESYIDQRNRAFYNILDSVYDILTQDQIDRLERCNKIDFDLIYGEKNNE